MDFTIGDCIYKKKYRGDFLVTDTTKVFQIVNLETAYTHNTHQRCVVAILNDGSAFELMDNNNVYAEKRQYHIFTVFCCCW